MKLVNKFLRSQLELYKPLKAGISIDSSREFQDRVGRLMHFSHRRDVVVNKNYMTEPTADLIVPRDELRGGILLYIHGGGFVSGSMDFARGVASLLSAKCGMRTLSVEYRLAPEHPYPAPLDDVYMAYMRLLDIGYTADRIILVGDSAGGGMAYSLAARLKAEGKPAPAGIIAISPWTDLTLSGESVEKNRDVDPTLTEERLSYYADCYAFGDADTSARSKKWGVSGPVDPELKASPELSPLFADLTGMPPSLIFVGGDEILLSDSELMAEKLLSAGSQVQLVKRPGMWHAYVYYDLKEYRADFDIMNSFIRKCMPKGNERKLKWMHIDNAGKIYPASRTSSWYNVFRVSMTLKEDVDREILQSALDVTVRRFPSIAVRLRRGFFWYYLEEIPRAPRVQDEKSYPLVRMPFDDVRQCAFRILVYRGRIAGEFFHSLTDGNGALIFMKTLVAEYLTEKYGAEIPPTSGVKDRLEAPREEEYRDLFPKYKGVVAKPRQDTDSYRIHGTPEPDGFCHVTTFTVDSAEVLALARSFGVTVTALLSAAVIEAAIVLQNEDCKSLVRQKEVKLHLPCDFRRIWNEETMRNFALYIVPGVDPRLGEYTLKEIAEIIYAKMKLEITDKNMRAAIYSNVKEEEVFLQKLTPLFVKNFVMKIYASLFGERKSVLTLSNLGVAKLPPEMGKFVERIDFILGTQASGPYNIGVVSYKEKMNINVIRSIKEPRLEMELYRALRRAGIHVRVESNER